MPKKTKKKFILEITIDGEDVERISDIGFELSELGERFSNSDRFPRDQVVIESSNSGEPIGFYKVVAG